MTPEITHLVAAGLKPAVAEKWIAGVVAACEEFGVDTEARIAGFLSQCAHESGSFTMLEENLNYRAATMAVCWPGRFAEVGPDKKPKRDPKGALIPNKFALALERKPEMIANVVYANRMANGPTESGDGWRYRGRGLKQLTGKENYTRCAKALGVDLVASPELLLEPEYAARSAAWFWSDKGCDKFADEGDILGLTKRINGGTIGLEDRKKRHQSVLAAMAQVTTI